MKTKKYFTAPEIVLGDVAIKIDVPEVKVRFNRSSRKKFLGKVKSANDVAVFLRSIFKRGEIELQEQFLVLFLNQANEIVGYYRHSKGAINGTITDIRVILSTALKCAAVSIIVCHNHPSGNNQPSDADKQLTKKLKDAAALMSIELLDHLIVTKDNYYSFADGGLLGIDATLKSNNQNFVSKIESELQQKKKHNKKSIEKIAATFHIIDKTDVKELTELAIVKRARALAHLPVSVAERFEKIVELYELQVNLSHRTSQSILLQQYSTPAPISYLAGVFCGIDKFNENQIGFEPSAGNGLLTIAGEPKNFIVNEIDDLRNSNLQIQGYQKVLQQNAMQPFHDFEKEFDAVLTNPPFGYLEIPIKYETFPMKSLEHLMALRALDCMKDKGKAAIIIGGHTKWDDKGRIEAGRNRIFFNYLYSRYNVKDVLQIDGAKLYSRQGTSFDVRLILIDGRKLTPQGAAPVYNEFNDQVINDFHTLYERIMLNVKDTPTASEKFITVLDIQNEQHSLELYQDKNNNDYLAVCYLKVPKGIRYFIRRFDEQPTEKELLSYAKKGYFSKRPYQLRQACDGSIGAPVTALYMDYCRSNNLDAAKIWNKAYEDYDNKNDLTALKEQQQFGEWQGVEYPITWDTKAFEGLLDSLHNVNFHQLANELAEMNANKNENPHLLQLENEAKNLEKLLRALGEDELGMPYQPASESCVVLDTQVPDSMGFETQQAITKIKQEVGGSMDNFVRHRLGYRSQMELCNALSAEQTDAVAMAIYNIEARGQGMIIGDQTGIGKGRIAASMIRYAVQQGLKPIFITEKANLFSDIYRDLAAIGSAHLVPFIVNGKESKTDIKDEEGNVVYQALPTPEQSKIFKDQKVPAKFDFVVGTYSQFNSPESKPEKPNFLRAIAEDNIIIMDEAHNSSGSSNTGNFMQDVVYASRGVVFLSATFAKRPDNMPIYAIKTAISECNMSKADLVAAITKGGVALQEVLASQLVAEGQMIRRERSFEGIEVNYISLDDKEQEHKAIADNITQLLRDIIAFQINHINKQVDELDEIAVAEGKEMQIREGTTKAGVDNIPYFSKVFQVINQMLFSIKAEAVADKAIEQLKAGKKPVIAFASTMGSFIEQMENERGMPVGDGDTINTDFAEVLKRGLEGVMRYTEKDVDGTPIYKHFEISELSKEAQLDYNKILEGIKNASTGITISPIDVIIRKIKEAGYSVAEVTGRKYELQINPKTNKGLIISRKKINTNDAFRQFNNNEVDVLMINQSGSTGASAHAIVTPKVPKEKVKQRDMIVLQAELDINTEVQKRGRINRTGQILKPMYDYIMSAIPAEKRLMMMLQKKLKSLDANTTSNQKQSSKILDVPDFLNKYGDKVVKEYLYENPDINELLDYPIRKDKAEEQKDENEQGNAAMKVSGRVAVLSTKMQQEFYNSIAERYNDYVEYLKQVDEYDLEVEAMNLQTETKNSLVIKMGKGGETAFGDDSILETVSANVLRKPFTTNELENIIKESLSGKDASTLQTEWLKDFEQNEKIRLQNEHEETKAKYVRLISEVPNEKKLLKIKLEQGDKAYQQEIKNREKELHDAEQKQIEQTEKSFSNRSQYLQRLFKFFFVGKKLNYPIHSFNEGEMNVLAVFLGFVINKKERNPFVPSAIKLRFAIANSSKYIAIPASMTEWINSIIGSSNDVENVAMKTLLEEWKTATSQNVADRNTRHIITGNLLQAFADYRGKLVSYTTMSGETKKGILMPENWQPPVKGEGKITVPIAKALRLIKMLTLNQFIDTNNGLSIFKMVDGYRLITALSRAKGGEIYLDPEIMQLIEKNKFESVGNTMVALMKDRHIDTLIEILQRKHNISLDIAEYQLKYIQEDAMQVHSRRKIELPPPPEETDDEENMRIVELEAEALALELELLAV